MAVQNTVATAAGLAKKQFGDALVDAVPDFAILQKRFKMSERARLGEYFAVPINLATEHGYTYNGTAGSVVTLNAAIAGTMKEAQVYGVEMILRSQVAYSYLERTMKGGERAFKDGWAWKFLDMNNSARQRLELSFLYGQQGLGTVESNTSGALVISAATWAPGIWAGKEGAVLEAFTTTAASATQHNGDLTITAVDTDTRTVTVSGTSTAVVANDILYFKGARSTTAHNDMAGLKAIIGNTGSLFGIDASAFSLWKGSTYSSTGVLSHAKIQDALAKAINKGLMESALVLVPPRAWGVLNSDQAALRAFDSSFSPGKGANGFESLQFYSANGKVEIVSHPLVKEGDAFILPQDSVRRVGSTDLTFGLQGSGEMFLYVPDKNAVEIQCFSDQAIFLERPAHAVYLSGLTY